MATWNAKLFTVLYFTLHRSLNSTY